jgi:hypothetical protein
MVTANQLFPYWPGIVMYRDRYAALLGGATVRGGVLKPNLNPRARCSGMAFLHGGRDMIQQTRTSALGVLAILLFLAGPT